MFQILAALLAWPATLFSGSSTLANQFEKKCL